MQTLWVYVESEATEFKGLEVVHDDILADSSQLKGLWPVTGGGEHYLMKVS